jgi:hypothetical protein
MRIRYPAGEFPVDAAGIDQRDISQPNATFFEFFDNLFNGWLPNRCKAGHGGIVKGNGYPGPGFNQFVQRGAAQGAL